MNLGEKPLHELTKEQLIDRIQDFQELISEIEHEVNMTIGRGTIDPRRIRRSLDRWVWNPVPRDGQLPEGHREDGHPDE